MSIENIYLFYVFLVFAHLEINFYVHIKFYYTINTNFEDA